MGDTAINACTRAIESKKYNGAKQKRVLSLLYTNRGVEYEIRRDFEHAIANHDKAIKIDPKKFVAYTNRCNTYASRQNYEHAIADFDRGMAKRNHGDFVGSESDIAQAKQLQPGISAQR